MTKPDLYADLGVPPTASPAEIRRAYRRAARRYHPDLNPGDPTAVTHFKRVTAAYEVLSDPERRSAYRQHDSSADPPAPSGTAKPVGQQAATAGPAAASNFQRSTRVATAGAESSDAPDPLAARLRRVWHQQRRAEDARQQLERRGQALQAEIARWEHRIVLATRRGRPDLARQARSRTVALRGLVADYQRAAQRERVQAEVLSSVRHELERQLKAARRGAGGAAPSDGAAARRAGQPAGPDARLEADLTELKARRTGLRS